MRTIKNIFIISLIALSLTTKGQNLILLNQDITLDNHTAQYDTVLLMGNSTLTIKNSTITVNSRLGTIENSTLNIENSTFTVNGISIFINYSTINIKDSVSFNGHMYLQNNTTFNVDSSFFYMDMDYYYQYYLFVEDNSNFNITNSTLSFNNGKLGGTFSDLSNSILSNLNFLSPVTFIYKNESQANLNNCICPIEFIFHDSCNVNIADSRGFIMWFGFDNGANANFSFPPPSIPSGATNITSYTFSSDSIPGITGVDYSINITNTDTVFFCTMQEEGSNITINNSFLFGCGFNFTSAQHHITDIYDDSLYTALSADFGNISVNLNNSKVFAWNFYPMETSEVFVNNSVYGELVVYNNGKAIINNSTCDGNGTKLGVYNNGEVYAYDSKFIRGTYMSTQPIIINKNYSFAAFYNCEIIGDFILNDEAKLYLSNTTHNHQPTINNAAYVLDIFLDTIVNAFIDSAVLITGTINDFKGYLNTDNITGYQIGYSNPDSSNYNLLGDITVSQPIISDTLFTWNTQSIATGYFLFWLTAYINGDSAISANRNVYLDYNTKIKSVYDNKLTIRNFPNPFQNSTIIEFDNINRQPYSLEIYDINGKLIKEYRNVRSGRIEISRNDLYTGIYIYKLKNKNSVTGTGKMIIK
jgi:hypothetical protein